MIKKTDPDFIPLDISAQDVIEAMQNIPGYIDITPGDFKEVYKSAYSLAITRLLNSLTAEKIMTKSVICVEQKTALIEAARLLAERQVSGGPVTDNEGKVVGVVSEKDFLREMGFGAMPSFMQLATHCMDSKGCMIQNLHKKTVGDIMTKPPITAGPEITISTISNLFTKHQINRLPIVNSAGRPIGMVTRTDLAHSYNTLGERENS